MLAQNFLTADELGLTQRGYQGLHRVLRMLEGGELVYTPHSTPHSTGAPNGFNMKATWYEHKYGTVGCIGGWAGFYNKNGPTEGFRLPNRDANLGALFCPRGRYSTNYTVDQAAHALRTYLVTGTPEWA